MFDWVLFNGALSFEDRIMRVLVESEYGGLVEWHWQWGWDLKYWHRNLSHRHFVKHKCYMDWPVIGPGYPATSCLNRDADGATFPLHLWSDTNVMGIRVCPALFKHGTWPVFACSLSSNAESSVYHVVWSIKVFQTSGCIQNVKHVRCSSES